MIATEPGTMNFAQLGDMMRLRRGIVRKLKQELEEIVAFPPDTSFEMTLKLFKSYAAFPTLSEHAMSRNLQLAMHPGATFAVSALFGEILLPIIRSEAPAFGRVARGLFLVSMTEFSKSDSDPQDLIEAYRMSLKIEGDVSHTEIDAALNRVREVILTLATDFEFLTPKGDGKWKITETGKRVLFHLLDAESFINVVSRAHLWLRDHVDTVNSGDATTQPPQ